MKRFLAALLCAVVLCAAAPAVAEGPAWITGFGRTYITIGNYHLPLPQGMKLVTEDEDESGITQNYMLEDGAEGKIKAVSLVENKIENVETLCAEAEDWKTMVDEAIVPYISNTERLTETVTRSYNLDELIFARLEAKGTDNGKYYNICFVRGKGDVLSITAIGDEPLEGEKMMESNLYYGDNYGFTPVHYPTICKYPDVFDGFHALIEGEILKISKEDSGILLLVNTGEAEEYIVYVPAISLPDYKLTEGDQIKAYVGLKGLRRYNTITLPYAFALGVDLIDK